MNRKQQKRNTNEGKKIHLLSSSTFFRIVFSFTETTIDFYRNSLIQIPQCGLIMPLWSLITLLLYLSDGPRVSIGRAGWQQSGWKCHTGICFVTTFASFHTFFFFLHFVLHLTSDTILNRSCKRKHPCFVPDLRGGKFNVYCEVCC